MKNQPNELDAFCDALEKRLRDLSKMLNELSTQQEKLMHDFNKRLQALESLLPTIPSIDEVSTLKGELRRFREAGEILVPHLNTLLLNSSRK